MDALRILEEKIITLVALAQDLKAKNSLLEKQVTTLQQQSTDLATKSELLETENTKLTEENFQLVAKLGSLETSLSHGSETIDDLQEEKALAKVVVDDLIKSIDELVETEQQ